MRRLISERPSGAAIPLLAGVLWLAGQACGQETAAPTHPAVATPVVTLLTPGSGPHQPLRFKTKVGAGGAIDLSTRMQVQQSVDGKPYPIRHMVGTTYTIETMIKDVAGNGDITYEFRYAKADVADDVPEWIATSMRAALKTMIGLRITAVMSDHGVHKSATVEVPGGLSPMLEPSLQGVEQMFTRLIPPLPAGPIGVGASWQVEETSLQSGMLISNTTVYRLDASDGDTLELAVEITEDAARQEVDAPREGPDSEALLTRYESTGSGRATVRLSRVFPSEAAVDLTNDNTMVWMDGDTERTLDQHKETSTRLKEIRD